MNGSPALNRECRIVEINYIKEGSNSDSACAVPTNTKNIEKSMKLFGTHYGLHHNKHRFRLFCDKKYSILLQIFVIKYQVGG